MSHKIAWFAAAAREEESWVASWGGCMTHDQIIRASTQERRKSCWHAEIPVKWCQAQCKTHDAPREGPEPGTNMAANVEHAN